MRLFGTDINSGFQSLKFARLWRFAWRKGGSACLVVGFRGAHHHMLQLHGRLWFINAHYPKGDGLEKKTLLERLLYRKVRAYRLRGPE